MRYLWFPLAFVTGLIGCTEKIKHDEVLAGKRAVEFAQVAFVKQDIEKGYALLSGAAKRYVSLEKFKETVFRLHPKGFPASVTATEYEPMPGEKAIYIYLVGENSGEQFQYTLTMEGSAGTDYKVTKITSGSSSYIPSTSERKRFGKPASTQR